MGSEVIDFNHDDTTTTNTGQAVMAIDLSAFGEVAGFKVRVDPTNWCASCAAANACPGWTASGCRANKATSGAHCGAEDGTEHGAGDRDREPARRGRPDRCG